MARGVVFRRKKQNLFGMVSVLLLALVFCTVIYIKSVSLKAQRDVYQNKIETLNAQIEEQHERTTKLEEYEKYTKTAKYVEEVAKEKLHLVYEDEIVFESGVEENK